MVPGRKEERSKISGLINYYISPSMKCFPFLSVWHTYKNRLRIDKIVAERRAGLAARQNRGFKQRASHLLILKLPTALCWPH